MNLKRIVVLCFCIVCSSCAWSTVFVKWSSTALPPAKELGISDAVFAWNDAASSDGLVAAAKLGYRVYLETPMKLATNAAKACASINCAGIVIDAPESDDADFNESVASMRSAYPKLHVLVLSQNGKRPEMRGSLVIKRDSVLEVSSPTAQPWLDTNLAFIKVEQRSRRPQTPFYTWPEESQPALTADDYALAVAEANAFHADLLLPVDEHLQQALSKGDEKAWALWHQVRSILGLSFDAKARSLQPAANVAVIVDRPDTTDEVLNLLSRHNIPFQVFLPADLKTEQLKGFAIAIELAKTDDEIGERIKSLAAGGATVVVVDARGKYPWQETQPVHVNEHTTSYAVGNGKVLELAEPVADPETFAQDIRRLLGRRNALVSVWNGLTTIAVPYKDQGGTLKTLEVVNYAEEPLRVQVQVKGSFSAVRYETPEHGCCQSLEPVVRDGFTEFVIPELNVTGRVHLESQ